MARFSEVLTIINGRNQKQVENPNGKYPIYGSGGIMGYADDYICDSETVVIGRKGSINNPIFVDTPFYILEKLGILLSRLSTMTSNLDAVVVVALITGSVSIVSVVFSSVIAKMM